MKYIIRHQFRDLKNYYVTSFFKLLYEKLLLNFADHNFIIENEPSYENNGYGSIYSCMNFSIINPINKKYILVSFFDNWKYHFMKHLGWNPSKMVQFFYPGGFNYADYFNFRKVEQNNLDICCPINIQHIYKPFFYGTFEKDSLTEIEKLYKNRNIALTKPELYFRGYLWDFRKQITLNIEDKSILIIDKNSNNSNLNYLNYLEDLSNYRCALSLPGGTEVCNRDIECFAIGIPVIRPFLNIDYPDPLIPNYHYISCYDSCKYWDGNPQYLSNQDFKNSLVECWTRFKENWDYLNFISYNARAWFIKNCILENNVDYILSQINLEKLYD
jgi:hypothetical protein